MTTSWARHLRAFSHSYAGMVSCLVLSMSCHPTTYNPQINCAQFHFWSSWFSFINWFLFNSHYISIEKTLLLFHFILHLNQQRKNASPSMFLPFNFIKNFARKKDDWHRIENQFTKCKLNISFHWLPPRLSDNCQLMLFRNTQPRTLSLPSC